MRLESVFYWVEWREGKKSINKHYAYRDVISHRFGGSGKHTQRRASLSLSLVVLLFYFGGLWIRTISIFFFLFHWHTLQDYKRIKRSTKKLSFCMFHVSSAKKTFREWKTFSLFNQTIHQVVIDTERVKVHLVVATVNLSSITRSRAKCKDSDPRNGTSFEMEVVECLESLRVESSITDLKWKVAWRWWLNKERMNLRVHSSLRSGIQWIQTQSLNLNKQFYVLIKLTIKSFSSLHKQLSAGLLLQLNSVHFLDSLNFNFLQPFRCVLGTNNQTASASSSLSLTLSSRFVPKMKTAMKH